MLPRLLVWVGLLVFRCVYAGQETYRVAERLSYITQPLTRLYIVLFRYLRPVPGTMYYIYWDGDDGRWGTRTQQQPHMSTSSDGAATAAGTVTPPAKTSTALTATAGHRAISPPGLRAPSTSALAASYHGSFRGDGRGDSVHQNRSNSLSATADAVMVAVAAAAAAAISAAPCPLFVRFEVVHDETVLVDGSADYFDGDDMEKPTATATVATAVSEGGTPGQALFDADDGNSGGSNTAGGGGGDGPSFPSDTPRQQRRRNSSSVVDASHTLSHALQATDFAYSPVDKSGHRGVHRFTGERETDNAGGDPGACADGSSLSGPQSHLCMYATTFPTAEWSRSTAGVGGVAGGSALPDNSGGSGSMPPTSYSPVKVRGRVAYCCASSFGVHDVEGFANPPDFCCATAVRSPCLISDLVGRFPMTMWQQQAKTRFGQYRRPRTLSAGDLSGVRAGGGDRNTPSPVNPSLKRLAEALREHMDRIYCSEVLRSLLRFTPVTLSTLLTVRRCLRPMPPEEITRFLVRANTGVCVCMLGSSYASTAIGEPAAATRDVAGISTAPKGFKYFWAARREGEKRCSWKSALMP